MNTPIKRSSSQVDLMFRVMDAADALRREANSVDTDADDVALARIRDVYEQQGAPMEETLLRQAFHQVHGRYPVPHGNVAQSDSAPSAPDPVPTAWGIVKEPMVAKLYGFMALVMVIMVGLGWGYAVKLSEQKRALEIVQAQEVAAQMKAVSAQTLMLMEKRAVEAEVEANTARLRAAASIRAAENGESP